MVWSASAAPNPCVQQWQWQWKTPPSLEIAAPAAVPDQCVGPTAIGPATVTATAGVKWEVDINSCPEPPHTRNETTVPITPVNTWELYSCPAGTTPLSGNGTTAQFTTIHAGSVVVQFKSQASVANPPWSALVASRTSPFGVGPEIAEPDLDPSTDNHFAFSYTAGQPWPDGACNITPEAICGGSAEKWLVWILPDISGCIKSVSPGDWPYTNPTLTYSRLPDANGSFGNKTLTVSRQPDYCADTVTVQLFFGAADDAVNHPSSYTPGGPTGVTPNWFYYWYMTPAMYGSPRFDPVFVQDECFGYTEFVVLESAWRAFLIRASNDPYQPPVGDNEETDMDGIDTFAYACRHEHRHVTCMSTWWPSGYNRSNPVDNDQSAGDRLPDALEPSLGGTAQSPINGGPFYPYLRDSNLDDVPDGEAYTLHTQSHWPLGSADGSDWSEGGHQWNQ
jgi:hypothetical protein